MERSAKQWTQEIEKPLRTLAKDIWVALSALKQNHGQTLIGLIREARPQELGDAAEQRWRRGIEDGCEPKSMGEALAALAAKREFLHPGQVPSVLRLLYDEPEPAAHLHSLLCPSTSPQQNVAGLTGTWRLVHQRSDNSGYLSWKVEIQTARESHGGPGGWFKMETDTSGVWGSVDSGRRPEIVSGSVHSSGALFYLVGAQAGGKITTASFQTSDGQAPGSDTDRVHGLIQRTGTHGPYAACAILTKDIALKETDVGSFDPKAADHASAKLRHDFRTIAANVQRNASPATLLCAKDIFGG